MTCLRCHHTAKKFGTYGKRRIQRYRCTACSLTFSEPHPASLLGPMRVDEASALKALECLIEGCSVRATERLTGIHRDTIMRLLALAGERCQKLLDSQMASPLTSRMVMRRPARLGKAFSRNRANLKAASALHLAFYGFCRVHKVLRVTPAMEAGITDHVWSIVELLRA
jgi:transposase-like protein